MKKTGLIIAALVAVVGISYAATLQTAGNQEKSKMGNSTLVDIVNANDVAINAEVARAVTNGTAATVLTLQRSVNLAATNIVITLERGDVVYGDFTNSLLTNVTITVQYEAVKAVTNATAATTLTLERR